MMNCLILALLSNCNSSETFEKSTTYSINEIPYLGDQFGLYFPDRDVTVHGILEPMNGRWIKFHASPEEFENFVKSESANPIHVADLVNNFEGRISDVSQFEVPSNFNHGWSMNAVSASMHLEDYGVYVFYDPDSNSLISFYIR